MGREVVSGVASGVVSGMVSGLVSGLVSAAAIPPRRGNAATVPAGKGTPAQLGPTVSPAAEGPVELVLAAGAPSALKDPRVVSDVETPSPVHTPPGAASSRLTA